MSTPSLRPSVCMHISFLEFFFSIFGIILTSQKSDAEMKGLESFCLVFMFRALYPTQFDRLSIPQIEHDNIQTMALALGLD